MQRVARAHVHELSCHVTRLCARVNKGNQGRGSVRGGGTWRSTSLLTLSMLSRPRLLPLSAPPLDDCSSVRTAPQ